MKPPWRHWYHLMASTFGQWLPGDERGFRTRHHREHVEGDYKAPPPKGKYDKRHERAKDHMKRPAVWLPEAAREKACREIAGALKHYGIEFIDLCVTATHLHLMARIEPWVADEKSVEGSGGSPPTGVGGLSFDELKVQVESAEGWYIDDDDVEPPGANDLQSPPTPVGGRPMPTTTNTFGLSPQHHRKDGLDPRPRYFMGKLKSWCSRQVKRAELMQCNGGLWAKRGKVVPAADRAHAVRIARYIRRHVDEGGAVWSLLPKEEKNDSR